MRSKVIVSALALTIVALCGAYRGSVCYGLGGEMALIPAGEFQMGDAFGEGSHNERPVHTVYVDAFFMDKYEVSNGQYRQYRPSHDSGGHDGLSLDEDDQPVVEVSWWDAVKYCNWRSRQEGLGECYDESTWECDFSKDGYRLLTEAEWEYAARGGLKSRRYVWGDGSPPSGVANVADETAKRRWSNWVIFEGYDDGYAVTAPVGSFSPNGYGLYDMAGNVREWCNDWYEWDYYSKSPSSNPTGPTTGTYGVFRGGSWFHFAYGLRCAVRDRGLRRYTTNGMGFRCAKDSGTPVSPSTWGQVKSLLE